MLKHRARSLSVKAFSGRRWPFFRFKPCRFPERLENIIAEYPKSGINLLYELYEYSLYVYSSLDRCFRLLLSSFLMNKPDDPSKIIQTSQLSDIERQIKELKHSQVQLENHLLTRHTQVITWIFTVVGFILVVVSISITAMGVLSKNESQAATQRMERQVDDSITRMNTRFDRLSGEFLKKPDMDILMKGQIALDGKRFEIGPGANLGPTLPEKWGK